MAINPKVQNAHIRWLRAQVKSATKDALKESATEAAHKRAMDDLRRHGSALSRALEAKKTRGAKGQKKKGRKKGRR